MPPNTADDRTLMDELNRLGEALGPFVFGISSNTLSITEQLAFGYRLIAVAGRIRTRVEQRSVEPRHKGEDAAPVGEASPIGPGDASQVGNGDAL